MSEKPMDDVRFSLSYAPVTRMEYGRGGGDRGGDMQVSMGNNRVTNCLLLRNDWDC